MTTQFTSEQLIQWKAYEDVRSSGKFNMFDPKARLASGLTPQAYGFCMGHYAALKTAFEAAEDEHYDQMFHQIYDPELTT